MDDTQTAGGGDRGAISNDISYYPPTPGKLYFMRYTLEQAFGVEENKSSSASSYVSSTTSSSSNTKSRSDEKKKRKKKHNDPNRRPVLVLYIDGGFVNILITSRLHGLNPLDDNSTLLPNLPRADVIPYILPIEPASQLDMTRRSVVLTRSSTSRNFSQERNYYVILKVIKTPANRRFPKPIDDYFETSELIYINNLLFEIEKKKLELERRRKEDLINNPLCFDPEHIQNEQEDCLPQARSNDLKFMYIRKWLSQSSSPDSNIDKAGSSFCEDTQDNFVIKDSCWSFPSSSRSNSN